jgi:hypothetical protein
MAIPAAPTASTVILQTGNGQNLISWPIIATATSYSVQRSIDGVNFSSLSTPAVNYYVDSTATIGGTYYYQVSAVNISGGSAYTASYPASITPCLPGQINLGYLRYFSQLAADQLNSTFLTQDEWNFNINQSGDELYDILVSKFGDNYFLAPPLLIPLTGLDSYPLPDGSNYPISGVNSPACYKPSGLDANISGATTGPNAGWVPLSRSNWSDRDRYTTWPGQAGALNNIYQMSYRVMGNNIYVYPANTNQTLRFWYVPVRTQMLLDTDMLPYSMSGWSEYVIVDSAIKAARKEESFELVADLKADKMALLERIETIAANRDVDQPNTISNVRATMGDPGFSNWGNGYGGGGFGGGGWGGGF